MTKPTEPSDDSTLFRVDAEVAKEVFGLLRSRTKKPSEAIVVLAVLVYTLGEAMSWDPDETIENFEEIFRSLHFVPSNNRQERSDGME